MYKCKWMFIVVCAILFLFNNYACASEDTKYVLIYDQLYKYAQNSSDTLRKYMELKSDGKDVLLLHADKINNKNFEKDSKINIVTTSFNSKEKYDFVSNISKNKQDVISQNLLFSKKNKNKPVLMISINRVYPFSDFNKLMDLAEELNKRGINFIVSVMPVYDNYELRAFDTYINVLKYVSKMGGRLFIHYPVENNDGTYNIDPRIGLSKAVSEFRRSGLNIIGITLSQDKLFNKTKVFEGLNLPFILVTEAEKRIDSNLDLYKVSHVLNNYIIINGTNINNFEFFDLKAKKLFYSQLTVDININKNEEKLLNLLDICNNEAIPIKDFRVQEYQNKLQHLNHKQVISTDYQEEKSQLERFVEEEMKKIKGENMEEEQFSEGYDISGITKVGIKICFVILSILVFQVLIGRRLNIKKFFKN